MSDHVRLADVLAAVEAVGAATVEALRGLTDESAKFGQLLVREVAQLRVDAATRETSAEERHTEIMAALRE